MWRFNYFVGQKPLFTPLYIFPQFPFCHPINIPVSTFQSGIHFKSLNSSRVYCNMFLIEGREMVYLKMGVEGTHLRKNVKDVGNGYPAC